MNATKTLELEFSEEKFTINSIAKELRRPKPSGTWRPEVSGPGGLGVGGGNEKDVTNDVCVCIYIYI